MDSDTVGITVEKAQSQNLPYTLRQQLTCPQHCTTLALPYLILIMMSLARPLRSHVARHVQVPAVTAAYLTPTILSATPPASLDLQVRHRSNRSRRGLYDGKDIRSGNNVSFSMKCTRRKFKPNVFIKRVYSEILDDMVQFHLTASALRSIDKAGGLDNYLMNNDSIVEGEGYETKQKIVKRLKNQARMDRKAAEALAAPPLAGNMSAEA
jgi:large subunit ribosomal protein L28